jgi:scyllo-inositol 2-dehydrogenase (NADP+)
MSSGTVGGKEKVKTGIVGLGRSGWDIHARLLGSLPDHFQIVAVSDFDENRRAEAKTRFNCRTYTTLEELLADKEVELAVIATPNHLHAPNAIAALKAGKTVVCEKPMATSLAEADAMIAAARKTGAKLAIFQNRRYFPDFLQIREVIQSGKLGRIFEIKISWYGFSRRWDWQTLKQFGGGTLNNTGPHALDMALQLFGPASEPEVFCQLDKILTLGDADDHAKVIIRAPGAPLLDIEISSACAYPVPTWLVMGTQGTLTVMPDGKISWKYFKPQELTPRTIDTKPTPDRSYNRDDIKLYEETWSPDQYQGPGEAGYYLDIYKTVRRNAPVAVTPESVRRMMYVLEKCHQQCPLNG